MNRHRIWVLQACAWTLIAAVCLPSNAQSPAASFAELRSKLKEGESVEITDDMGRKLKARISEILDHSITVTANGASRDFSDSAVQQIRKRRPDPRWNGVMIGLAAGVGAGAVAVLTTCPNDPECSVYASLVFFPVFGGIGAGAGAAIDFAIKKYDTVYIRPGASTRVGLRFSPIRGKGNTGIRVALVF